MISESSEGKHRGFYASLIQSSSPLGNVLATGVFFVLNALLPNDAFLSYGWRISFWFSAIITLLGLYIRGRMRETPAFQNLKAHHKTEAIPVATLLKDHWRTVLACVGVRVGSDTAWTVFAVFSIVYVTKSLGLPRDYALSAGLIAACVQVFMHAACGAISDRVGRRSIVIVGSLGLISWSFAFFPLLNIATHAAIIFAVVGGLVLHSLIYGPMASWFVELFPANIRFSGASISHQIASLAGGAIAPVICLTILSHTGKTTLIVVYVCIAVLFALLGALSLSETRGRDLIN